MKILVTGATGFVGGHVVASLVQKGHDVIASGTSRDKASAFEWFDKVRFTEYSLSKADETKNLFQFFEAPDAAIHLAWQGLPNYKDLIHIERNLCDQFSFLRNLIHNGLKNITITGTCLEYGMINGCLSEDIFTMPANPYALAKDTLRKLLQEMNKKYGFSLKWVRLFYMHGPGQNPSSIIPLLDKAIDKGDPEFNMSGGEQLRDYLFVKDVAENIVSIALQTETNGILNCCSGKPISVRKLVEDHIAERKATIKLNPGHYPYPDYEPMAFWGDKTKLQNLLDSHGSKR